MGQIKEYQLENGKSFRAYIPDNVSDDTPVLYYSYVVGSEYEKDSLWQGYENDMITQNPDSIIIIPEDRQLVVGGANVATHKYQNNAVAAVELINNELGIKTTQFTNGGFSAGFGFAVRTSAHYIQANPDAERQVVIAVDGVMNDSTCIQSSELQALKDNNTIIVSYSQPQNFDYQKRKLESTGLPILYVVDPTLPENSGDKYWGYHDYMTQNFFNSGLYESVMDFVNGKGELPENFTYKIYDPSTGTIREINRDEVANFLGIEEYVEMEPFTFNTLSTLDDYEIKSKSSVMTKHLNNIKSNISSSSLLSSSWGNTNFNSTTRVPSEIPSITNELFTSTSELLTKLANELFQFAKVTASIEDLNNQLEQEAEELNNPSDTIISNQTNSNTLDISQSTTNQTVQIPQQDTTTITTPSSDETPTTNHSNDSYTSTNTGTTIPSVIIPNNKEEQEEYPKYDELYSDDTKVVYEYKDDTGKQYKIVIHKDENNKVIGIEHYYEYKTNEEANSALITLKEEYKDNEFFDEILIDNNHIKITFKEDMYKDITIESLKEKYYKELNEVLEEE